MKFSVLMSVYNKEEPLFLKCCFKSLASQTIMASEVILVEDGFISKQLTKIIDDYREILNIKSIKLPVNKGLGNALNIGLSNCSHSLVARMDTDDVALPNRFEKQIKFLEKHSDVDILGSGSFFIDRYGIIFGEKNSPPRYDDDIKKALWACPIIHPSVMFRKSFILSVGSYSRDLKRRQDYELWFRCAKNGGIFHNLDETLLMYRVLESSHKKNSFMVALEQAKIGIKGSFSLKFCRKNTFNDGEANPEISY